MAYIPAVGEKKIVVIDLKTQKETDSVNLIGYPIFIIFSPNRGKKNYVYGLFGKRQTYLRIGLFRQFRKCF